MAKHAPDDIELGLAKNNLKEAATSKERVSGMDLNVYKAAKEGNTDALLEHSRGHLDQMLTATKNTVLHINIACSSSANQTVKSAEEIEKSTTVVRKMLDMCPQLLPLKNDSGETALHIAAKHGCDEIVEVLIEYAKRKAQHDHDHGDLEKTCSRWQMLIREPNKHKDTALHEAVRFNHLDVVERLTIEDPEFSDCANDADETPLYMAAERGYHDLVSKILANCSCPAYKGPNGKTALHIAVIYKDERIMKALVETRKFERALTEVGDEREWTPLHYAAFFGHTSIVKSLLDSDKSAAYVPDVEGKTALHIAASKGNLDVLKELISRCPDCCELVDHRGRNVLHYSIQNEHIPIECFTEQDPWLSNVLLNGKDDEGNTPLHILAIFLNERAPFLDFLPSRLQKSLTDARVDKMAFNKKNLNAVDVIDEENVSELEIPPGCRRGFRTIRNKDNGKEVKEENKGGQEDNDDKKLKENHLLVATLISTVTFAAGITMPGGYESDKGPHQGFVVLARNAAFKVFVISNTIAFTLSSASVLLHFDMSRSKTRQKRMIAVALNSIIGALIAMVIAFITGTYAVLGCSPALSIAACVVGCFYSALILNYLPPSPR